MTKWKSIESAPMHVEVLVYDGHDAFTAKCLADGGWVYSTGAMPLTKQDGSYLSAPPLTHWLDLPDPPS